jgi:predicted metal-dependent peptidase
MSGDSKEEMMGRIITAAEASGRLPEDIELWVRSLKASRVPWERVLRSFLHQALSHDDIGWLPPSRRHLWDDRYLPSARPGRRGRLVAAVDTSGSISQGQLRAFAAEIKGLFEFCDELTAVTCDAKVRECVRLGSFEDFLKKLKFKGGGGTDFRPVFELAEADRMRPDALVYLTDGKGIFPKTRPARYPVLWCLTEARAVPWGFSVAIAKQ